MAAFSAQDLRAVEDHSAPNDRVNPHAAALEDVSRGIAGQARPRLLTPTIFVGLVRLAEFGLAFATGLATFLLLVAPAEGFDPFAASTIPIFSVLLVLILQTLGCYRSSALRAPGRVAARLAGAWILVCIAGAIAGHLAHLDDRFERDWLLAWMILSFAGLAAERASVSWLARTMTRSGRMCRRTVIVGGGPAAEELFRHFAKDGSEDLHILGLFDDRTDERSPHIVSGFPKLGNVDDLVDFGRRTQLDLVIFTLPITAEQRLLSMLRKLWVLPVDIRLSAHANKLRFRPRAYSYIGEVPVIDLFDRPIAEWDIIIKSVFDRVVGAFCLLALSPIMLLVALAVKLDSRGPVLFKQKRHGFNNEEIEVYKFRSMYTEQLDFEAKKQVTRDDPRVTPVGRFIRKTSLDELPQLFNVVFKGNLSLVGPRPHVPRARAADAFYDEVVDGYFARHRVRPGITGWAQINGWRGETDTPEKIQKRVECDLYYIENWSIFFDIYVLLMTPIALLRTKNAY